MAISDLKKIDGSHFEEMVRNGYANICLYEEDLNRMNVFPVADGDTGSNMRLTLENGIAHSIKTRQSGAYFKALTDGMLYGARGNSGVILSQLFRGMFLELCHYGSVNVGEMRDALIRAYKTAYSAVAHPVEGTILTVAREGIEHIKSQIDRSTTMANLFSMYVAEMRKSLNYTPELLPALKDAGVVDSGALGYIYIMEGMMKYFYGIKVDAKETKTTQEEKKPDLSVFDENSSFEEGYCMEFILQLMNNPKYIQRFNLDSFKSDLQDLGNSLVCVQDGKRIKVHIHTFKPANIIKLAQEYGEFLTFKLENMQLQHDEVMDKIKTNKKHKPLSIITVSNGDGLKNIFYDLGVDYVIEGGEKMNASANDFIKAFKMMNSDKIVVIPNNKNLIGVINQAIELSSFENVVIIPTENLVQGYYALGMDVQDSNDKEYRIAQMTKGYESIKTIIVSKAIKDIVDGDVKVIKGNYVGITDGHITSCGESSEEVALEAISKLEEIEDKESCVIIKGIGISKTKAEDLLAKLEDKYPDLEVNYIDGGQFIYDWIIGVC